MYSQDLIKKSLWLVIFIYLANALAMKFHWYFTIWWYDMPMHFLGGLFVGLISIFVYLSYFASPPRPDLKEVPRSGLFPSGVRVILVAFLSVLIIGVLWEIFESGVNFLAFTPQNPMLDTLSDISFDLAGGFFAAFYYLRGII